MRVLHRTVRAAPLRSPVFGAFPTISGRETIFAQLNIPMQHP
jgi:hypothetical protein